MKLYNKGKITISTIEESDKEKILEYFSENDFNCSYETGALRPSNGQFLQIMDNIISGKDDESNVFVLKKNGEVIGYESMFVEYDILHIGHIAVKKSERGNGYGKLLTKLAILVAENEDRDVALYCDYPNSYLEKLGFKTKDRVHYLYKRKGIKSKGLKRLFVKPEEYSKRKDEEMKKEVDRFKKFLDSDIVKAILREEEEK